MFHNQKFSLVSYALILVFLASFAWPAAVFADQGTPPATGPSVVPPSTHKRGSSSSQATITNAVAALSGSGSVLSESGQAVPLGSVRAVQILSQPLPDPVVCPAGSSNASAAGCVPGYSTISDAITAAAAGSVIFVQSGTYTEQLVIDKSLTLIGAGSSSTTVQAPASMASDPDGNKDIVLIEGSTTVAAISGFTISGPGTTGCDSINYGIFVRNGATANIHGNVLTNIRDTPLGGCQNGVAIRVGSKALGQKGTAKITNNVISDYQKGGIVIDNAGSYADIVGNTVQGAGATPYIAQNGIQISRGATASIVNNVIEDNLCDFASCGPGADQDQSTGILLYESGDVTVRKNRMTNNDMGLYSLVTVPGGSATVTQNIFDDNRYENVLADQGTLNLQNNTLTGGNYGLWAYSFSSDTGNTVVDLQGNHISDTLIAGVRLDEDAGSDYNLVVGGTGNAFTANPEGVLNDTTTLPTPALADFRGNWWDSTDGPMDNKSVPDVCGLTQNNPLGTGNGVSPCVLYDPWLTKEPSAGGTGSGAGGSVPPIIPVTGGKATTISCDTPSMLIQVGDVQVTLTGLCGYEAVLDQLLEDSLAGNLGQGNNFVEGISIDLLKDGTAVNALPAGATIQVSYPKPSGNASILTWTNSSWIEKPSSVIDGRVVATLDTPATNVLVTR
ncbi:MAG TPA: right-handed parallel beta-helix repeat-containing protein [Anaerolineales bacterium]|nr:right-handed parallel beta-helix repeat-containing protein [Anaerolineales bacterium]